MYNPRRKCLLCSYAHQPLCSHAHQLLLPCTPATAVIHTIHSAPMHTNHCALMHTIHSAPMHTNHCAPVHTIHCAFTLPTIVTPPVAVLPQLQVKYKVKSDHFGNLADLVLIWSYRTNGTIGPSDLNVWLTQCEVCV